MRGNGAQQNLPGGRGRETGRASNVGETPSPRDHPDKRGLRKKEET